MIINNNNFVDFCVFNQDGKSMMHLALEMDKLKLSKNYPNKNNYNPPQKTHLMGKMQDIVDKWNEAHTIKTEIQEIEIQEDENKENDNEDIKDENKENDNEDIKD
eukprot:196999_1